MAGAPQVWHTWHSGQTGRLKHMIRYARPGLNPWGITALCLGRVTGVWRYLVVVAHPRKLGELWTE